MTLLSSWLLGQTFIVQGQAGHRYPWEGFPGEHSSFCTGRFVCLLFPRACKGLSWMDQQVLGTARALWSVANKTTATRVYELLAEDPAPACLSPCQKDRGLPVHPDQSLRVTDISEIMPCKGCVDSIVSVTASLPLCVSAGCSGWIWERARCDEVRAAHCANSPDSHFSQIFCTTTPRGTSR